MNILCMNIYNYSRQKVFTKLQTTFQNKKRKELKGNAQFVQNMTFGL